MTQLRGTFQIVASATICRFCSASMVKDTIDSLRCLAAISCLLQAMIVQDTPVVNTGYYGILKAMEDRSEERRKRFGSFLRELRKKHYQNQGELAHVLDVSQATVSEWELGKIKAYAPEELRDWSDALRVPMVRLLKEAGFLTDIDITTLDPDLYINPYVQMLADRLPPLGSEADAQLVADLAWAAKNWAIAQGAPAVQRGSGQTTQVETPGEEAREVHAGGDPSSLPGVRIVPSR